MSPQDHFDDAHRAVAELVGAARKVFGDDLSAREQAGVVRFEQAVAHRMSPSGTRARRFALGFGLAAVAAAGALVIFQRPDGRLTFRVVNGAVSDGGYVRGKPEGGTELRFSDGSTFALDPGASTRVTAVDAHGSRVRLERGRAHMRVTHLPAARWTVEAGSYAVQVVGTEFDVRWSESAEVLDVRVQAGKIVVRGPLATGGVPVEAGQHLVASGKNGEIILSAAEDAEIAPAVLQAGLPPGGSRVRPAAARPTMPPPALNASWSKMIARGDFQGVLTDAEQNGLTRTLDTASVTELNALADAARYVRRNDVARRTLVAALDRFPHSGMAHDAPFFLGGLAEKEPGVADAKAALDWYQRYMAESPRGAYAAHALGREMLLVHKLRGASAARPLAADYLRRFPSGPYAAPAQKLLQD